MVSVATSVGVSVNVFTFAHQNKFNKSTSKKTQKMNQENPKMRK
jgi:peroxiredoxin family protein